MEENKKETEIKKDKEETELVTIKLSEYKQLIKDSLHKPSYNQEKTPEIKKEEKIIFVEENREEKQKEKKPFFSFKKGKK